MIKHIVYSAFLISFSSMIGTNKIIKISTFKNGKQFILEQGKITESKVDAIVNAANPKLLAGGGVCGAIFDAAGHHNLQQACYRYPCINNQRCPTGGARITPSFQLASRGINYIIHAVGPDCRIITNPQIQDQLLQQSYTQSLQLAANKHLTSVAFPFISSGIYGFEKSRAATIAIHTIADYLKNNTHSSIKSVHMVLYNIQDIKIFTNILEASNDGTHQKTNPGFFEKIKKKFGF